MLTFSPKMSRWPPTSSQVTPHGEATAPTHILGTAALDQLYSTQRRSTATPTNKQTHTKQDTRPEDLGSHVCGGKQRQIQAISTSYNNTLTNHHLSSLNHTLKISVLQDAHIGSNIYRMYLHNEIRVPFDLVLCTRYPIVHALADTARKD